MSTSSSPSGDPEINENVPFPPATVAVPAFLGALGPPEIPTGNFNPGHVPQSTQGPPTFVPYYQDNGYLPQNQFPVPYNAPPNVTVFGTYTTGPFPQFEVGNIPNANVNFEPSPFVPPPMDNMHGAQSQIPPPMWLPPEYPIPVNGPWLGSNAPGPAAPEAPLSEDESEGDQPEGKRRKLELGSMQPSPRIANPEHMKRSGRGGSLLCDHCRKAKRGKKRPCLPVDPRNPNGPCGVCVESRRKCRGRHYPQGSKKEAQRLSSLVAWVDPTDLYISDPYAGEEVTLQVPEDVAHVQDPSTNWDSGD